MIVVEVRRKWETARSVTSELWVDGKFQCYGLEPSRSTPVHEGHPCIPAGHYDVRLSMSPHLGYETPEVLAVPGRTAIRWHIGNFPQDVLGCIAIGDSHAEDVVTNSRIAFTALMAALRVDPEHISATYTDPTPEL